MKGQEAPALLPAPGAAPCRFACPIDQNVQEYVACIAEGRFLEAVRVIRRTNPFPSVCGRICPRPCESECTRGELDGSVSIRELKRFAADLELMAIEKSFPFFPQTRKQTVAVVGAGPAGLAAAFDLRRLGYGVTVYEALPFPGGMLAIGFCEETLPRDALAKDIDAIRTAGVVIETGRRIGTSTTLEDLRKKFPAVLVATGAPVAAAGETMAPARDLPGFLQPAGWLARRASRPRELEGKAVVIDGLSASSVQWALLAAGDGARSVTMISPFPESHFPVETAPIALAEKSGVRILALRASAGPVVEGGRMAGLSVVGLRPSDGDARGRAGLAAAPGRPQVLKLDAYIPAGPRTADRTGLESLAVNAWGLLAADTGTMMVDPSGVFAAGDAAAGARTVVESIASGRRVAAAIHRFLSNEETGEVEDRSSVSVTFSDLGGLRAAPRPRAGKEGPPIRTRTEAVAAARRCLRCAACHECDTCHPFCRWTLWGTPSGASILRIDEARAGKTPRPAGGEVRLAAVVDASRCDGCGACEPACPYNVINTSARPGESAPALAVIDEAMCRACGLCAAVCPPRAIAWPGLDAVELSAAAARLAPSPAVFRCRWSGGGAENGGIGVGCLGQIPSTVHLKALEAGCRSVLAVGCGEKCHHRRGFERARDGIEAVRSALLLLGMNPAAVAVADAREERAAMKALKALPASRPGTAMATGTGDTTPEAQISSCAILFARTGGGKPAGAASDHDGVACFPGCYALAEIFTGGPEGPLAERMRLASRAAIEATGIRAAAPPFAGCCGLPFLLSGERERFEETALATIGTLGSMDVHTVVVPCSDCLRCLRTAFEAVEGAARARLISLVSYMKEAGGAAGVPSAADGPLAVVARPGDPDDTELVDFLGAVPGARIAAVLSPPAAVGPGWRIGGKEAGGALLRLADEAARKGARRIVTASHHLVFHLRRALAAGSWRTGPVEVVPLEILLGEERRP